MVNKRSVIYMIVSVWCSDIDDSFICECDYFTINSRGFVHFCCSGNKFSIPIYRFYCSNIFFRIYLSQSNYLIFYKFCEKVGCLC